MAPPRLRPREGPDLDAHAAGQEAESFSIPGMFALTLPSGELT